MEPVAVRDIPIRRGPNAIAVPAHPEVLSNLPRRTVSAASSLSTSPPVSGLPSDRESLPRPSPFRFSSGTSQITSPSLRSGYNRGWLRPQHRRTAGSTATAILEPQRRSVGTFTCNCGISRFALEERQSGRRMALGNGGGSGRPSSTARTPSPSQHLKNTRLEFQAVPIEIAATALATTRSIFPAGLSVPVPCMNATSRAIIASSTAEAHDAGQPRYQKLPFLESRRAYNCRVSFRWSKPAIVVRPIG